MRPNDMLDFLDRLAARQAFLMIDNAYFHFSRAKLHAFCSNNSWCIAFQVCGLFTRTGEIGNFCDFYSPELEDEFHTVSARVIHEQSRQEITSSTDFSLFSPVGQEAFSIAESDYVQFEIPAWPPFEPVVDVARLSGWLLPDRIFLSPEELLQQLESIDLKGFRQLLELDDWYHPSVSQGELPSGSPSFRQIAEVVASKNANIYTLSGEGNTHLRNWIPFEADETPYRQSRGDINTRRIDLPRCKSKLHRVFSFKIKEILEETVEAIGIGFNCDEGGWVAVSNVPLDDLEDGSWIDEIDDQDHIIMNDWLFAYDARSENVGVNLMQADGTTSRLRGFEEMEDANDDEPEEMLLSSSIGDTVLSALELAIDRELLQDVVIHIHDVNGGWYWPKDEAN